MLNALDRLAESYAEAAKYTRQELAVSEAQLSDYQQRIGKPFAQEDYLKQLTALRDQLRTALSSEHNADQVAALAEQIKALLGDHSVEAAPERTAQRRDAGEEPVTAKIRRRAEAHAANSPAAPTSENQESETGHQANHSRPWQRKIAQAAMAEAQRIKEVG